MQEQMRAASLHKLYCCLLEKSLLIEQIFLSCASARLGKFNLFLNTFV